MVTILVTIGTPALCLEGISAGQDGGEGQNRTADTAIFSRVLCQLSYLAGRCLAPLTRFELAAFSLTGR